jgi:hypothetical protein
MVLLRFLKDKKEWQILTKEEKALLSEEVQENEVFYMDGLLKKKLDFAKQQQNKNNDVVGTVVGDEGSGKSSLAGNIMRYMSDDEFDPVLDMVGADYDDGLDKIENRPNKGYLMFDEGNTMFLSTETMKKEQRELHKIFSIFRQRNLFVLIVLPSFFRLGTYFALDRSRFMIRTYLKNGDRSFFAYWGNKKKDRLYRIGKKLHSYDAVAPTFRGRFNTCYPLENPEYKKFKNDTLLSSFRSARKKKIKSEIDIKRDMMGDLIAKNPDTGSKDLSDMLGITQRRVQQIRALQQEGAVSQVST